MEQNPTYADVRYGEHERNVMDVWLAKSDTPTPCVMMIHGGGWLGGDKSKHLPGLKVFLAEGISVVSINYRYLKQTIVDSGSTSGTGHTYQAKEKWTHLNTQHPTRNFQHPMKLIFNLLRYWTFRVRYWIFKPYGGTGPLLKRADYPEAPVKAPLHDAARAIQYLRYRAAEWNINPRLVAVTGESAGACSSLWLAFHDDLAQPDAEDPVKRQSTKPYCAATNAAQTSLDPLQILEWIPNATYGGHAFGFIWDKSDFTVEIRSFLAHREDVLPWIKEYSPYELVTKGAPPVYLLYGADTPEKGKKQKDPTHSSNYGALLAEKLEKIGLPHEFVHKGSQNPKHKDIQDYLVATLKAAGDVPNKSKRNENRPKAETLNEQSNDEQPNYEGKII